MTLNATLVPFAHHLPYWHTRSWATNRGPLSAAVLFDGTLFCGFEASGVDVFSSEDERLNEVAARLRTALNALPPGAYVQTEWSVGHRFDDVLDDYERQCRRGPDIVREQRAARLAFLKNDATVRRGRLYFYVGLRRPFGAFSAFGATAGLLDKLLRREKKGPESITPDDALAAAQTLADIAHRFAGELTLAGMKVRFLDEAGLVERIFVDLNPISAQTAPPPAIVDGPGTSVEGLSPYLISRQFTLREQLPRGDLFAGDHHFTVDEPSVLSRALSLQTLPSETTPDYLFNAQFALEKPCRIVSTFEATDLQKLTETFLRKQRIATSETGGSVRNIQAEIALGDIQAMIQQLSKYDQRIFEASVTAIVTGADDAELDRSSAAIKEAFRNNADLTCEVGRQLRSFLASLPGYGFSSPRTWRLHTSAAADLVPYFVPSLGDNEAQLVYHTRQSALRKVSYAKTSPRPNRNALVFGPAGSGKSFTIANVFEQAGLADGATVRVIDVQGPKVSNYKVLAELFGGSYVALGADDVDVSLNPFPAPDDLRIPHPQDPSRMTVDPEKIDFLARLLAVMTVPDFAASHHRALYLEVAKDAVVFAYDNVRSLHARATGSKEGAPAPLFSDVLAVLNVAAPADERVKNRYRPREREYEPLARSMYLQLDARLRNPRWARLLNRPGSFSSQAQMQVFDFFGMEKDMELATVLIMIVANYIWSDIQSAPRDVTKFVMWDECWKLIGHPTAAETVAELFRTGRKWGASVWAITQSLNDLLTSPVSSALLANSSTIWLNRHAEGHDAVANFCQLNQRQAHLFKGLQFQSGRYSEVLFVDRVAGDASILRNFPTAFDLWLNTTNPADVALRDRVKREEGVSMAQAIRLCAERYPQGAPR